MDAGERAGNRRILRRLLSFYFTDLVFRNLGTMKGKTRGLLSMLDHCRDGHAFDGCRALHFSFGTGSIFDAAEGNGLMRFIVLIPLPVICIFLLLMIIAALAGLKALVFFVLILALLLT